MTLIEVACARILERVEKKMISIRGAIEDYVKIDPSIRPVRDVILALCLGTVRNYVLLDYLVRYTCGIDLVKLSLFEKYLIRVLAYEVKFRECSPDRAKRVLKHCRGVRLSAQDLFKIRDVNINDLTRCLSIEERLHVRYSVPLWLVKYLISNFGLEDTEKMLAAFNDRAPLYIRVNIRKVSREELLKRLIERGVEAYPDEDLEDVIYIERLNVNLESLEEYRTGLFYIQDKSSALVGHVTKMLVLDSFKVVDACSAPGGKAMHLQEIAKCYIIAADVSYRRLLTERGLVARYSYTDIDLVCANMLRPPLRKIKTDVVLLDPDCTSLGKLAHSPEVRLWIRRHHIRDYARHQYKLARSIINNIDFKYLVYSTCTITIEENEQNITKLCEEFNLEVVNLADTFKKFSNKFLPGTLRLFPHTHRTGGYFIAVLRRVK